MAKSRRARRGGGPADDRNALMQHRGNIAVMADGQIRLFLSISAGVMVVFGVGAIIGFRSRPRKTGTTVLSALPLLLALVGAMFFAVGSFAAGSASIKSERLFNTDPGVKRALASKAIDTRLPQDDGALKSPWALVTVDLDKDGGILKTDYTDCSYGRFTDAGQAASLRTIVFAYAYPYDTVTYSVRANGQSTGRTVKVQREAGILYFYDMAEGRFVAQHRTGPSGMPDTYDGAGAPSGAMTSRDFLMAIQRILYANGQ